jgi:hypothetical protein
LIVLSVVFGRRFALSVFVLGVFLLDNSSKVARGEAPKWQE